MEGLALAAWIVTAAGGLLLAAVYVVRGGLRRQDQVLATFDSVAEADRRLNGPDGVEGVPAYLVGTHGAFALAGLALWIGVVAYGEKADAGLPWVGAALVIGVAGIGLVMFRRWLRDRRTGRSDLPEQRLPSAVVYLHGLAALVTVVLVVAAAAGLGD
jgi:hypothetical protein